MKGTEKIIAHIRSDAEAKAAAILAQAEQQCAVIREDYDKQAKAVDSVQKGTESSQAGGAAMASSVAAIGIGIGMVGSAAAAIISAVKGLHPWWMFFVALAAVVLVVSVPSMILAYFKLRRRDLGAILNASGWAINREMRFSMKRARGFTKCVPPCRAGSGGSGHVTAISGK